MKNKSVGFYGSSLEMLLDTMCAMLGGVVFIALTVALFTRGVTAQSPEQYQRQAAALSNDLAAVTVSNTVVESRLLATLQHLQDPHQHFQTNAMRLPNLADTTRQQWVVIIRHGKLYPLDVFTPGGRGPVLNTAVVAYQPSSGDIEPRPERGDAPANGVKQMVQAFRANASTNYYFAFAVYPDSFDAFVRARETAAASGYQYGWDPVPENQRLRVSRQGEQILPQN